MTPTTALGLSIRLSMFELRETGDWDLFLVPWNGRGRRLVEMTDGCYSGGDSQGLSGFIHPRVLGIPTISFQ